MPKNKTTAAAAVSKKGVVEEKMALRKKGKPHSQRCRRKQAKPLKLENIEKLIRAKNKKTKSRPKKKTEQPDAPPASPVHTTETETENETETKTEPERNDDAPDACKEDATQERNNDKPAPEDAIAVADTDTVVNAATTNNSTDATMGSEDIQYTPTEDYYLPATQEIDDVLFMTQPF